MAQSYHQCEKTGLVFGLCPDTSVYLKLVNVAGSHGLAPSAVRAAGNVAAFNAIEVGLDHAEHDVPKAAWRDRMVLLDRLDRAPHFDADPLLNACFSCLSAMPGGAPWQGSWRGDRLRQVLLALEAGGVLLAIESHSLEEQCNWARTLLKSGCAFVQTHDDVMCS